MSQKPNRLTMMGLAVEIMEEMYRQGHTVRSALTDLGAEPRRGRSLTWEDVVGRIFKLLEADWEGCDLLAQFRHDVPPPLAPLSEMRVGPDLPPVEEVRPAIVRLPPPGRPLPRPKIVRATKLEGPCEIEAPRARMMGSRA